MAQSKAFADASHALNDLSHALALLESDNAKLRELAARAWRLFTENGAVHPSDLSEVDAVRDGLRELGVEVDA